MPPEDATGEVSPGFTIHDLQAPVTSKSLRDYPTLLRSALALVWRSGRLEAVLSFVVAVAQSLVTLGMLAVIARLVARIRSAADDTVASDVGWTAVLFVALLVLQGVLALLASELRFVQGELVMREAQSLVARAAASAPLLDFERPRFHDRLQRALANSGFRPLTVATALTGILSSSVAVVGLVIALVVLQPILLGVIVLGAAPLWLLTRRSTRLGFQFALAESEADRRRDYFLYVLTSKEEAQEVRAYELGPHVEARHRDLWTERIDRVRALALRRTRLGLIARLVNGAIVAGVLGVLLWTVSSGRTGVDAATAAAGAVVLLGQRLNALMAASGSLYECGLFLRDTESFLRDYGDQPMQEHAPTAERDTDGILTAAGLRFRYPAGSDLALEDVSVEVRTGEMIALVGANGSGKTTAAKIVAGLMPPDAGDVRWNGASVVGDRSWTDHVAIVFQDFCRYMLDLTENIGFGRVEEMGRTDRIRSAADMAGLSALVDRLPNRFQTLLGPEFIGGTNLSGGQWQRVALARAFFRDAPVVILDEPSAALDPVAEEELFTTIRDLCRNRAVIVISHRFSTVTAADRIYVLDGGHVIESGSHQQLLATGGRYAEMFRMQASRYGAVDVSAEQ